MRNLQNDARIALIETRRKQELERFDKSSMYPTREMLIAMNKHYEILKHSPMGDILTSEN